ncbi:MAG TPA: hypothetical protein VNA17_02985 [Pyrinomonadaceae bacterium]|nr:hypothetical protein [Pyrinomonadaceae bacterium]
MNTRKQARPPRPKKGAAAPAAGRRWLVYFLIPICVALMVSGFFLAGQQHFASMDYGMKNSRLKKQIEALEAEKRRLLLARELSISPAEIKRAAKKTGLLDAAEIGAEIASVELPVYDRTVAPRSITADAASVVKTASVAAISGPKPTAATYSKSEKREGTTKKAVAAEKVDLR